jgi:hypothetical protein
VGALRGDDYEVAYQLKDRSCASPSVVFWGEKKAVSIDYPRSGGA